MTSLKSKFQPDDLHHALDIAQHIIIPEPQHLVPPAFEPGRALGVLPQRAGLSVLSAITFDDQIEGMAREVSNIIADRRLPSEMKTRRFQLS